MEIQLNFKNQKLKIIILVLLGLFLVAFVLNIYFFWKSRNLSGFNSRRNELAAQEAQDLLKRVSKLIVLPKDEEPTLATVNNPEQLKSQQFFVNAKQGDKVLIYSKAKKAVLYDPEKNMIIEVAPLNLGDTINTLP